MLFLRLARLKSATLPLSPEKICAYGASQTRERRWGDQPSGSDSTNMAVNNNMEKNQ